MNEPNFPTHELEQLLEKFREAQTRADERAKVTHERFNVFTTLLKAYDEVRLHTRFLHCLLDPNGCHGCGSTFLDLFFTTLKEPPGVKDDSGELVPLGITQTDASWSVRKEASCPDGQIDLLLEQPGFKIAIENKINAGEQDGQLARYSKFLRQRASDTTCLLYLTKEGKKSVTHGGAPYIRISYADHILTWLEKCLRETHDIIPINQVLLQYRAVVLKLTGKNLETKAMKEISEFITNHPDIIRFRKHLDEGIIEARASFLDRLAKAIINELVKQYEFQVVRWPNEKRFGTLGDLMLTPPPNSILRSAPFKICVENNGEVLAVGISEGLEKPPLPAAYESLFKQIDEQLKLNRESHSYDYDGPRVWDLWPTGWHNLIDGMNDDETLAELIKTPFPETVANVCNGIRSHIKLLENIYTNAIHTTNIKP